MRLSTLAKKEATTLSVILHYQILNIYFLELCPLPIQPWVLYVSSSLLNDKFHFILSHLCSNFSEFQNDITVEKLTPYKLPLFFFCILQLNRQLSAQIAQANSKASESSSLLCALKGSMKETDSLLATLQCTQQRRAFTGFKIGLSYMG